MSRAIKLHLILSFDATMSVKQGSFLIHGININHESRAAVWIVKGYSFTEFACQMEINKCHVTLLANEKAGQGTGIKNEKGLHF